MKKYRVWASQTLYDSDIVEADSLEEAAAIAERMFMETGELDPGDINDSDYGAELFEQILSRVTF